MSVLNSISMNTTVYGEISSERAEMESTGGCSSTGKEFAET